MNTSIMFLYFMLFYIIRVHGQAKYYNRECNVVTIPMCLEMPYNTTRIPNLLQHRSQEEAAIMAHEFLPLVDIKCSPFVRFFICSVFAPMCTEKVPYGVPSCRSVCKAVREACLPVLRTLNLIWPKFLQCDSFPKEEEGLCMVPPNLRRIYSSKSVTLGGRSRQPPFSIPRFTTSPPQHSYNTNWASYDKSLKPHLLNNGFLQEGLCLGPRLWVQKGNGDGLCVPFCEKDFLFAAKDKKVAMAWAVSWAIVSLLSTSFSLLTFCLDRNRFDYPERPVICLALSYFCYSVSFIVRLLFPASALSCETDPTTGEDHLAASGISSPGCITTFLLQYYFGIASEVWWTILTFCWFMTACRFWGSEGLKTYATYFHAVAWGVPALASVTAITMKQVSGDELLGMCFVGTMDPQAQLYLVILPQGILLTMGTTFIVLGFISLFRIRNAFRREFSCTQNAASSPASSLTTLPPSTSLSTAARSTPTVRLAATVGKLERLMVRLGVFSVLSTLPALFVLGCRLHAHFKHNEWTEKAARASASCETGWNQQSCGPRQSHPEVEFDLLKIFMSLIIGVTSGIWVWSHKTITLWKHSIHNLLGLKSPNDFVKSGPEQQIISPPQVEASRELGATSRGYMNLQESWNPLIGSSVTRPHCNSRSPTRVLHSWGLPDRDYDKGRTSSEITSFV